MPWKNAIAVGRAYDLTREDLLEHLRWLQKEIGYQYCRFHALFHDDMNVVTRDESGTLRYQWHHVDKIYDALLGMGLKPFVELNPMPSVMAGGTQQMFHYKMNVTPPNSYDEWRDLVAQFARHCVSRYGLAEVRSWYFEVWNEPNLSGFWSGTKEDYWKLYQASAEGLKSVDRELRIGGPASSKANWVQDIIEFCHKNKVPLDFISTHLYPQDEYVTYQDRKGSPHEPGAFFGDVIHGVQSTVTQSAMPHLPIHWTEWNTLSTNSTANISWTRNTYVDSQYGASFIAKHCIELDSACDTLCYWTASDIFEEKRIPNTPFSGTYGLLTPYGTPKAHCNAFRFLARLRGDRLGIALPAERPEGTGACATREADTTHVLMWNHRTPEEASHPAWTDTLRVSGIGERNIACIGRIKPGAGSAYESWLAMGRPQNLSHGQEQLLRAHSHPEYRSTIVDPTDGTVEIPVVLQPGEVVYVEIMPLDSAPSRNLAGQPQLALWDKLMGEQSRT